LYLLEIGTHADRRIDNAIEGQLCNGEVHLFGRDLKRSAHFCYHRRAFRSDRCVRSKCLLRS
jgi:hypothetical protein